MSGNPDRPVEAEPREFPRRFYAAVRVAARADGHAVLLDEREIKTPARRTLSLPVEPLAEAVAEEWRAQEKVIDPGTMPLTRMVNAALDGVAQAPEEVRADIVRFAEVDLVCYRAGGPDGLVAAQRAQWDPMVDWARDALGVKLALAEGVMHVPQPAETPERVAEATADFDALRLTAVHVMTTLTGSCVIALAVARGAVTAEAGWDAAHVDEDWQISQWGEDAEARERRQTRWREMEAAARMAALLRG